MLQVTKKKKKKNTCNRKGRFFAVFRSFEFLFCFSVHAYDCIFFNTDAIEINWKSIPCNGKSSCVLSEKIVRCSKQDRPD